MSFWQTVGTVLIALIGMAVFAFFIHLQNEERKQHSVTHNNYNISGNTIAALNLGNVLGDLNASVQSLQNHGAPDVADLIQKLTTGISNSKSIKDED